MQIALPELPDISLRQSLGPVTSKQFEGADAAILFVPVETAKAVLGGLEDDGGASLDLRRIADVEPGSLVEGRLGNRRRTRLVVVLAGPESDSFRRLEQARKAVAASRRGGTGTLLLAVAGDDMAASGAWLEAGAAAALAAEFRTPSYRSRERRTGAAGTLTRITLAGHERRLDLRRTRAEAEGNALARYLTLQPPNMLTPGSYRNFVQRLAKREAWRMEFLDEAELKRRKAGAFLAVVQGSSRRDAGIVHLRYRPDSARDSAPKTGRKRARPVAHPLALVGKGICFDTGGVNLKPFRGMLDMHGDMQGSAVALGTFLALTRLGYRGPLDCWLALAVNDIDAKAFRSHDVVTACDGTTIEVIHTDAEGRMVLADTLALAGRSRPAAIMDYATLTGACVAALTDRYSGVFSDRTERHADLIAAGRESGERVWPFPLDEDFDRDLESPVADVRQCPITNDGDHIMAARFLKRFVPADSPWIHVDLAAGSRKGGLGHIPTDVTGFGVRFSLAMILDKGFGRGRRR